MQTGWHRLLGWCIFMGLTMVLSTDWQTLPAHTHTQNLRFFHTLLNNASKQNDFFLLWICVHIQMQTHATATTRRFTQWETAQNDQSIKIDQSQSVADFSSAWYKLATIVVLNFTHLWKCTTITINKNESQKCANISGLDKRSLATSWQGEKYLHSPMYYVRTKKKLRLNNYMEGTDGHKNYKNIMRSSIFELGWEAYLIGVSYCPLVSSEGIKRITVLFLHCWKYMICF